jgi:hypothetical protein
MAKKTKTTRESRFVLHRFNGDEVYRFNFAIIHQFATADGVTLVFEVRGDRNAIARCEDTADAGMAPKAEVDVALRKFDPADLVGKKFSVPGTKTDEEDSAHSLFYYFEHEPLRKNKITVISKSGNLYWVRWTAVTKDVNYYDGSKPLAKIEIEGEFEFVEDIRKFIRSRKDY